MLDPVALDLLRRAAEQFRFYERNHRAKADAMIPGSIVNAARQETLHKADVNADMAAAIEGYLSAARCVGGSLMDYMMDDVREFHEVFAPDWLPGPLPLPLNHIEASIRAKWIKSEATELVTDTETAPPHMPGSDDMVNLMAKQADAFLDAIYFAAGGLVRMRLDPKPLWKIIHGQNMAKRQPDGSVKRREGDGKIVKPEDWVDPHELLVAEIKRQIDPAWHD